MWISQVLRYLGLGIPNIFLPAQDEAICVAFERDWQHPLVQQDVKPSVVYAAHSFLQAKWEPYLVGLTEDRLLLPCDQASRRYENFAYIKIASQRGQKMT